VFKGLMSGRLLKQMCHGTGTLLPAFHRGDQASFPV